jgi:hypothetical protein
MLSKARHPENPFQEIEADFFFGANGSGCIEKSFTRCPQYLFVSSRF